MKSNKEMLFPFFFFEMGEDLKSSVLDESLLNDMPLG